MSEFKIVKSEYNALGEDNNYKTHFFKTSADQVVGLGRMKSTAYSEGDVVFSDTNNAIALKCTTAGTTSDSELDISANAVGDSITDGGVVWLVIDRGLPIATQAQAEAGSDNTTVMTPLRVTQEMLKFPAKSLHTREIITSANKTVGQLRAELVAWLSDVGVNNSTCYFSANSAWLSYWNLDQTDVIFTQGARWVVQNIGAYNYNTYCQLLITSYSINYAYLVTLSNGEWGELTKIATNGALSMPSENYIAISMTSSDFTYTAPADGWVTVRCLASGAEHIGVDTFAKGGLTSVSFVSGGGLTGATLPVRKGQAVRIISNQPTSTNARFCYAESEV